MRPISDSLYDLLVSQGLSAGPGATSRAHGMKERGAASDGARSQVMADAAGGTPHRPTAGEEEAQPMRNSGKDRGNVTPAKFTGLRLVSSRDVRRQNPTSNAPLGLRTSLMLVWSR